MSFTGPSGDPARELRIATSDVTFSAHKKQRHGHPPRVTAPRHNARRFKRFRKE